MAAKEFRPIQVTSDEVGGSFDRMLRRFIRRSKDEGIIEEVRSRIAYKKPSEIRRTFSKRDKR